MKNLYNIRLNPNIKTGLQLIVLVYCGVLMALYFLQGHLIFRAGFRVPNLAESQLPRLREVRIPTLLNENCLAADADPAGCTSREYGYLTSWFTPPLIPSKPMVLYLHGNGGTIQYRRGIAKQFLDAGYGLLMLEYRGYGGNPGKPTPDGLVQDARAAMEFLRQKLGARSKIYIYGESIGGAVAIQMLTKNTDIAVDGLVLYAPFTNLADVVKHVYPWVPVDWLLRYQFDNLSFMDQLRLPILVMHGAADNFVPPDMGRALYEAANQPKELFMVDNANHYNLWDMGATARAIDFINRAHTGLPIGSVIGGVGQ
jgi:hypothetical protein